MPDGSLQSRPLSDELLEKLEEAPAESFTTQVCELKKHFNQRIERIKRMKPHVLVTNDDGIHSRFLHLLVEALVPRVSGVAAPKSEQSWIGRAISRHAEIEIEEQSTLSERGCRLEHWRDSSDCVNI